MHGKAVRLTLPVTNALSLLHRSSRARGRIGAGVGHYCQRRGEVSIGQRHALGDVAQAHRDLEVPTV